MEDKKHVYTIIGLLVVVIVLLVMILNKINTPAADLVSDAGANVMTCKENIDGWNKKYSSKGPALTDSQRNELSAILADCTSKIGESY
ncbi:MAG: hypothetical protein A3B23_00750 [Candidatus Colwellbacteria bacterium RIFCSPLOWO2_01_FULL_48_10]|uniref:Uncharacterized protein n=2 Tax=Bacteria candidate phyla TaxID=1783234 RepID=A0A1F5NZQ4_9BACT|nr:MAG: hypothetical protein A2846_03390 [Candidatus Doudnabacteria bacterium RIFCSPHIGHO2_01_FULL_49_9]OGY59713.1 MAG: hypothetical protein A3B23_00750 [Candidatus Colwellbacteria bacterium RIFCSPLOWO2_01_FULL_48_10]